VLCATGMAADFLARTCKQSVMPKASCSRSSQAGGVWSLRKISRGMQPVTRQSFFAFSDKEGWGCPRCTWWSRAGNHQGAAKVTVGKDWPPHLTSPAHKDDVMIIQKSFVGHPDQSHPGTGYASFKRVVMHHKGHDAVADVSKFGICVANCYVPESIIRDHKFDRSWQKTGSDGKTFNCTVATSWECETLRKIKGVQKIVGPTGPCCLGKTALYREGETPIKQERLDIRAAAKKAGFLKLGPDGKTWFRTVFHSPDAIEATNDEKIAFAKHCMAHVGKDGKVAKGHECDLEMKPNNVELPDQRRLKTHPKSVQENWKKKWSGISKMFIKKYSQKQAQQFKAKRLPICIARRVWERDQIHEAFPVPAQLGDRMKEEDRSLTRSKRKGKVNKAKAKAKKKEQQRIRKSLPQINWRAKYSSGLAFKLAMAVL